MEPLKRLTIIYGAHNKFLKIKTKKHIVTYRLIFLSKLEVLYLMTRMYLLFCI